MKNFYFVLLALVSSLSALAGDSPETVLARVAEQCSGPRKCMCLSESRDGLKLTFGNGADTLLTLSPDFSFTSRPGEILSLPEADLIVQNFKNTYGFEKVAAFCSNAGGDKKGLSEFGYNVRYSILDIMINEQLRRNGGFCNAYQKCACEFSMGGFEMSPDFRKSFEISVEGDQQDIYNGGSSGGPILRAGQGPILVKNLGSVLRKSAKEKEFFIAAAIKPLETFREVCRDFEPVLREGKESLRRLIHDLEHPSESDDK